MNGSCPDDGANVAASGRVGTRTRRGGRVEDDCLDALVMESLRSRPPLVDAVRNRSADASIGEYRLAADTTVMVSIPVVHQMREALSRT
jgi:cytochrome P450